MSRGGQDQTVPTTISAREVRDVGETVDELDRLAAGLVAAGRPKRVVSQVATLDMADFEGHAWASVLAAAALLSDSSGCDPRIDSLLMSAEDDFWRDGDERGLGHVAYVRGNRELAHGNFSDASAWWQQAREFLGEDAGPLSEIALAHLSLAEFHQGNLQQAFLNAEEALSLARRRRNRRGEGLSLLYLAFFSLWVGDFGRAETLLATSRRIYGELLDPIDRFESSLVETGLAALQAMRWHRTSAEAMFESALQASESLGTEWFTAIIRAIRAELCAPWNPARSIADANLAIDFLSDVMSDAWWLRWARRARAVADMHAGNLQTSSEALRDLLHEQMSVIERTWTVLALAESRYRAGDTTQALEALHEGLLLADESGSRYHLARSTCLLSEVDIENRQQWHARASEVIDRDPAYRVLLTSRTPLRIDGFGRGRILVGDRSVKFATRHAEAAVFMLALEGPDGVNAETLAERLWPNVASSVWPGRVRTLLWQIRRTLGDEAWRLERDGSVIRLELAGATFDVDEARQLAGAVLQGLSVPTEDHARLLGSLRQPLVTAYQYEDWLTDYANELHTLEAKLAPRSGIPV
jgi:tetratricopeptide (TPR) repeat protein